MQSVKLFSSCNRQWRAPLEILRQGTEKVLITDTQQEQTLVILLRPVLLYLPHD